MSDVTRREFLKTGGACALCLAGLFAGIEGLGAQSARLGFLGPRRSPWFRTVAGGRLECTLCPHRCRLASGERGRCRVRENRRGEGYTLVYGAPCLVQIDPIERTPFHHVAPGSRTLSVSTAGCPIECAFCEVWDVALVRPEDVHSFDLPPAEVVRHARTASARAVSYAFGEPVGFFEYMLDTAVEARKAGLLNTVHTSGYIEPEPLAALARVIDAANVDLKGFDPAFYREFCGAELEPVLATLRRLADAGVHLEITTIVIPTLNDEASQIRRMCEWIRAELGAGVPLHFARFYPMYKLTNLPPTPVATLDRARDIALQAGLEYVYVARVTGHVGENTFCPRCGAVVLERIGFLVEEVRIEKGRCGSCGAEIPGLFP